MDLLFICQEYPFPPRNGIRLKLFNVLSFIARRHQCDVLAFDDVTDEQLGMARDLASPEVRVLGIHRPAGGAALRLAQLGRFVTGRRLPSAARWTTQSYSAAVHNALARGYDVIHYDMANVTGYASLATGTPAVFSINDSLSRYFELESQNPSIGMLRRVVDRRLAAIARSTERDEYPR